MSLSGYLIHRRATSVTDPTVPTRGERNNNPLNLDFHPTICWQGQRGVEVVPVGSTYLPRFACFSSPLMGLRAGAKELIAYITKDGADTVTKIVSRWAPSSENDTDAYNDEVCASTGFTPTQVLTAEAGCLVPLVRAMAIQENGRCIYSDDLIRQAVFLALGGAATPIAGIV